MKKLLSGIALGAFLAAAPAMAADLPARMPVKAPEAVYSMYNWSGWYIGGHAGYGFGNVSAVTPGGVTLLDTDLNGFVGGVHTGVNWQVSQWVFGLEGSLSFNGANASAACAGVLVRCEADMDHFWRAGGRIGFAAGQTGNWLFYGMGGYARAKFNTFGSPGDLDKVSQHHAGWYAGGGIEYALASNFIIGVEAYHVNFDTQNVGVLVPRNVDLDFTVVQARASYKFNWGGPVVARY